MAEIRSLQQEHRRATAAHQEAQRSWMSERRALEEQHTVNESHALRLFSQRMCLAN